MHLADDWQRREMTMKYEQIWQVTKRLPTALAGVAIGAALMYGTSQFPVLVEVTWGGEESYVKFDNRMEHWCEARMIAD